MDEESSLDAKTATNRPLEEDSELILLPAARLYDVAREKKTNLFN